MNINDPDKLLDLIHTKTLKIAERSVNKIPYTTENGVFDDLTDKNISWWTNGFWAGMLWQLYGAYGDTVFRNIAEWTEKQLDCVLLDANGMDHDSGFRWLPTAGASYILTKSESSKNRLMISANDLAGRFNPAGGYIRAWNDIGDGSAAGLAIIDCMMNLPLLYCVSEIISDPRFRQIAMCHADTAMTAFVREDGSVCHIVEFDPETGRRLRSLGGQGYGHGSSWTRGQAWGIYGFTLSYIHTKKREYLNTAVKIADRFVSRIPESCLIPVDFDQPHFPAYEDSTAAAIAACGLIELAKYANNDGYHKTALKLLGTLADKRLSLDENCDYLLEKCTAAYHDNKHEFSIIYGDYYFTEAVAKLCGKETFIW
ncbi:MAG: glycoside hydrolase family 88 protein [Oscillospiraceae bacterium]|nr:glycoside hydrolase family 88 protein [Oscillospiraceae bacterium]